MIKLIGGKKLNTAVFISGKGSNLKNLIKFSLKKNLSLLAIDTIKTKKGFEFNLLFSNNGFITLSSEIIEVTLEDLKEIKNDL